MELKGQHRVIGTCHLLKPVMELEAEGLRVHPGEPKAELDPKVVGDKGEAFHRETRHPPPEYHVGIVGSQTIPRTTAGEKLENI